jgi:periplasmic copper chaperone A
MMKLRLILAAALLSTVVTMGTAFADSAIKVEQAWARATPGGAKTGAIYLTLTNTGTTPDTLTAISTPAADKADLHEMKIQNNIMEMRPVAALPIAPGQTVTLEPSGYHIMLTGLKAPLKEGDTIPLTLTFEHAAKQDVTASVTKLGAMRAGETGTMPGKSSSGSSSMPGMTMPGRQH